jgi:hypothetical protein
MGSSRSPSLVAMVITQVDLYDNEADALEAAGVRE